MKKKTAVEWLFSQMTSTWYDTYSAKDILKQAKEIEKEQIKDAYWNGTIDMEKVDALQEAEQYYNKIYTDGTI